MRASGDLFMPLMFVAMAIMVAFMLFAMAMAWREESAKYECRERGGAVLTPEDGEWRCQMPEAENKEGQR